MRYRVPQTFQLWSKIFPDKWGNEFLGLKLIKLSKKLLNASILSIFHYTEPTLFLHSCGKMQNCAAQFHFDCQAVLCNWILGVSHAVGKFGANSCSQAEKGRKSLMETWPSSKIGQCVAGILYKWGVNDAAEIHISSLIKTCRCRVWKAIFCIYSERHFDAGACVRGQIWCPSHDMHTKNCSD